MFHKVIIFNSGDTLWNTRETTYGKWESLLKILIVILVEKVEMKEVKVETFPVFVEYHKSKETSQI